MGGKSIVVVAIADEDDASAIIAAIGADLGGVAEEVLVLHVREHTPRSVPLTLEADADALVEGTVARLHAKGVRASGLIVACEFGRVPKTILATADKHGAGVVIVGHYRQSALMRWLEGSVSSAVTRRASVAVVVVPVRAAHGKRDDGSHRLDQGAGKILAINFGNFQRERQRG